MSMLPAGVYKGAITHDDSSLFRQRMQFYKQQMERKQAEQKLRQVINMKREKRA